MKTNKKLILCISSISAIVTAVVASSYVIKQIDNQNKNEEIKLSNTINLREGEGGSTEGKNGENTEQPQKPQIPTLPEKIEFDVHAATGQIVGYNDFASGDLTDINQQYNKDFVKNFVGKINTNLMTENLEIESLKVLKNIRSGIINTLANNVGTLFDTKGITPFVKILNLSSAINGCVAMIYEVALETNSTSEDGTIVKKTVSARNMVVLSGFKLYEKPQVSTSKEVNYYNNFKFSVKNNISYSFFATCQGFGYNEFNSLSNHERIEMMNKILSINWPVFLVPDENANGVFSAEDGAGNPLSAQDNLKKFLEIIKINGTYFKVDGNNITFNISFPYECDGNYLNLKIGLTGTESSSNSITLTNVTTLDGNLLSYVAPIPPKETFWTLNRIIGSATSGGGGILILIMVIIMMVSSSKRAKRATAEEEGSTISFIPNEHTNYLMGIPGGISNTNTMENPVGYLNNSFNNDFTQQNQLTSQQDYVFNNVTEENPYTEQYTFDDGTQQYIDDGNVNYTNEQVDYEQPIYENTDYTDYEVTNEN